MEKTLKVIKPFGIMEKDDEFVMNENGTYTAEYNETTNEEAEDNSFYAQYQSRYTISPEYAQALMEDGFLTEVKDLPKFVNVFDEIDKLSTKYTIDLQNIDQDCDIFPACVKVEKETVLKNILKVLDYLKSLKK